MKQITAIVTLLIILVGVNVQPAFSQLEFKEPEVKSLDNPATLLDKGLINGMAFSLFINNYGFGIGGRYRRTVGPLTQFTTSMEITALKDASEQTLNVGQQIVPNKFKRVLTLPLKVGVKRRFFARDVSDNFRVYMGASAGPAVAFVLPYFKDINDDNVRTTQFDYFEPNYDFFKSWKKVDVVWGASGDLVLGIDFGNMKKIQSVQFGYSFHYFPEAIQIMQPVRPDQSAGYDPRNPNPDLLVPFFDEQSYFGTPRINIVLGGMW